MNLVELSEKLKDVPDQFLLKEVQNPTGSYPSYLVVSELTRRKKMRDKAQQVPQTSVAEDVARDTAQHNQQQQMQQQQQQMMQQQAGLGALPEAQESTAGRDALQIGAAEGQEDTQNMASGGLVAFAGGSRDGVFNSYSSQYSQDPFAFNDQRNFYQSNNSPDDLGYRQERQALVSKILGHKQMTPDEEKVARAEGAARYEKAIPFRGDFYDEDIAQQEKGMKSAKSDAASDSLIQAGLAIIGSRKPGLQGISEGGLKGFQTYIDAKKDIKNSERLLSQSKRDKANAQSLYDQGKYSAAEIALQRSEQNRQQGLALSSAQLGAIHGERGENRQDILFPQQLQGLTRTNRIGDATEGNLIEGAGLKNLETKADIDLKKSQALYYRDKGGKGGKPNMATPGEIKTSMDIAAAALLQQNVMPTDPNYNMKLYGLTGEILSKTGNTLDFGLFNSLLTGGRSVPAPSNAPAPAAPSSTPYASPLANTSYNNRIGNAATGGGNPIYNQGTINFSDSDLGKIIQQMNQKNGNR